MHSDSPTPYARYPMEFCHGSTYDSPNGLELCFFFHVSQMGYFFPISEETLKNSLKLLLMAEILHQFIGSLSHYLQGFSTIPGGAGFQPSTVSPRSCFTKSLRIGLPNNNQPVGRDFFTEKSGESPRISPWIWGMQG